MRNTYFDKNEKSKYIQFISSQISDEEYGVDILKVLEIYKIKTVTIIPGTTDFIQDEINVYERKMPVINLSKRSRLHQKDYDEDTKLVVVNLNNNVIEFHVDVLHEVLSIDMNLIKETHDIISSIDSDYIKSIVKLGDRLLIIIDLNNVLFIAIMEILYKVVTWLEMLNETTIIISNKGEKNELVQ